MDIRKIAAAAALAAGALAFAPLASADGLTSTVDSEIASLNSQFEFDALLAGDSKDIATATSPNFDSIPVAEIATVQGNSVTTTTAANPTFFDYLVYGFNPNAAGLSEDPTSGNLLNGAVEKFDDAYNVFLYAAENKDALIPVADVFGNHSEFVTAAGATDASAFADYYNFALGDLYGYLGLPAADYASFASTFDISQTAANELFTFLGTL
jgi:hypothetical protein